MEKQKKGRLSFARSFKETATNILIILLGFGLALGIFIYYKNGENQKEINSYIPNGKAAFERGEYTNAINIFNDAEKEFPNDPEVKRYLAKLYFFKGEYNNSKVYYENLKNANQLKDEDISNLGNTYLHLGNESETLALWNGKTLTPKDNYTFAKIYLKNKDYENYFAQLGKIKEYREPLIYSQIRETSLPIILANIETATNAESISDETIDLSLFKTQIQEAKKQLDANKKDFSELIQLAAFSNINQCEFITTRIKNLRTSFDSQKIPSYQVDYLDGKCANQANNPDIALPLINKAITADTTNIEYRDELAKTYFLKNDFANLQKVYEEIFTIRKTPTLVSNYSAYLYKLDKKKEALENYREALKISEDSAQKQNIAETILQIEFLDFQNLDVCKSSEIVEVLELSDPDQFFLRGHCEISLKSSLPSTNLSSIEVEYLKALSAKDKTALEKVLDKDIEGKVTSYYNAVGKKLI